MNNGRKEGDKKQKENGREEVIENSAVEKFKSISQIFLLINLVL